METTHDSTDVPAWPLYDLIVHDDGRIVASGPLMPTTGHGTRAEAVDAVAAAATRLGRAVRADATEPDGTVWHLAISPDGAVSELPDGGQGVAKAPNGRRGRTSGKRDDRPPARSAEPDPQRDTGVYAASLAQVTEHLQAGRIDKAAALAARLDEQAAGTLGVSDPDALRIREVRARVAAVAGDAVGSLQLFRDVAERWHYRGEGDQAEAAATRAETLWMGMPDVDTALSAGVAMVRLRNQMPGANGEALAAVLDHQAWLAAARDANGPRPGHPPALPAPAVLTPVAAHAPAAGRAGTTRPPRPAPSWERPAQDAAAT